MFFFGVENSKSTFFATEFPLEILEKSRFQTEMKIGKNPIFGVRKIKKKPTFWPFFYLFPRNSGRNKKWAFSEKLVFFKNKSGFEGPKMVKKWPFFVIFGKLGPNFSSLKTVIKKWS